MDRVQVLKQETAALGGDAADEVPWPAPIEPQEDAIEAAGVYLQDGSNRDETTLLSRSGNDATFTDGNNTSALTLSQLYGQPRAVGAYQSILTVPTKSGTSDFVPFDMTEFEVGGSSQHDPTISDSGTATGTQTSTTLQDTGKSWTVNGFANYTVQITGGTGLGQFRKVVSNTATTLTVGAWDTTPDATSIYRITELSTRLVAPVAGVYEVLGHASISYNAEVFGMQFYKNGSFATVHYQHQSKTIELHVAHNRLIELAADDYVEMKVYNGSGSAQSMFCGSGRCTFQMHKVGGSY